jgi:hypothetical protein
MDGSHGFTSNLSGQSGPDESYVRIVPPSTISAWVVLALFAFPLFRSPWAEGLYRRFKILLALLECCPQLFPLRGREVADFEKS